jgi:threonine 3-dehydrogenase
MNNPQLAKEINEEGSKLIIDTAFESGSINKNFVKFFFPSSIAVYGPRKLIKAKETDIIQPTTIYGKNKLLIERYGTKKHEESHQNNAGIDFRSIRFPGIISPYTIPNGGTTDFAPQMLHAAAVFLLKNGEEEYECKISADTKLPFIGIEEAINSIIRIMNMEDIASQLRSFNIQEISLTPSQIIDTIKKEFPNFSIKYNVEEKLQSVADTWPDSLNCEKAKKEWDFSTQYDHNSFFMDYLIPKIKKHYERN